MLIISGLLLAIGGFIFIFMPAVLLPVFWRRHPDVNRRFIWWGAGAFLVSLIPTLFLSSLVRQFIQPEGRVGAQVLYALFSASISGVLVVGTQYLLLRWLKPEPGLLPAAGLAVGLGVGVVTQVFVGFTRVGAGLRLLFGDTSTAELASLAAVPIGLLSLQLLAELMNRAVIFVFNGGLGTLVGRSQVETRSLLLIAMLLHAGLSFGSQLVQLGLAEQRVLADAASILLAALVGAASLRWLLAMPSADVESDQI